MKKYILPVNIKNTTIAQAAASAGQLHFLKKLVNGYGDAILEGVDDDDGNTLQHYACMSSNLTLIRWLLLRQEYSGIREKNKKEQIPFQLLAQGALYNGCPQASRRRSASERSAFI